jgi:hypothetical protein
MPAPTACTVCIRPDLDHINAALKGGTSYRSVEKTFAIGRTALTGHSRKCIKDAETRNRRAAAKGGRRKPRALGAAPLLKPIESAEDVVEELQRLRIEATALFEGAKARADWKQAQQLFGQLVALVDRFGEMHRVLGSKGTTVTVDRSTRTLNVLGRLGEAELRQMLAHAKAGDTIALPATIEDADEAILADVLDD